VWPYLAILALLGLIILHFWWRQRFVSQLEQHRNEIARLSAESKASAEEAVARQRAVLDSMAEGLLLLDDQARVQWANRKFVQFFGLGESVQGRTVLEATRSHELAELTASVKADSQLITRTLRLPGAAERHVDANAVPIIGRQGRPEGMVLVLHDISRLRRLEKTREEFVANVSHELRTPLSLIKGYSETLLDDSDKDPEVVEKFLKAIDRNTTRLQLLIEDLLAIASLESGQLKMEPRPIPLRKLVEEALEEYQTAARLREIEFGVKVPDVWVKVDRERLHQVFGNLFDNAVKYGGQGGHVTATARTVPDRLVEVCVRDDGPGVPSDALERIFERFYRVDKARSRDQGGTGLGLSSVKHIVQTHGGQVWAESDLGKGTAIFFTLPQADSDVEKVL